MAAPATYTVNGEHMLLCRPAIGGAAITVEQSRRAVPPRNTRTSNRIIAFKLGGPAVPLPRREWIPAIQKPPQQTASKRAFRPARPNSSRNAHAATFSDPC